MWSKKLVKYARKVTHHVTPVGNSRRKFTDNLEFLNWLSQGPKKGDILVYESIQQASVTKYVFQYVIDVQDDFTKVGWDTYTGYPTAHEVVSCHSLLEPSPVFHGIYPRWVPWTDYKLADINKVKEFFSVELQDNLASAAEEYLEKRAQASKARG